jgi:hypothetical protein
MNPESSYLIEFLLGENLIGLDDLVAGDVIVGRHRSRNLSYGVFRKRGPSYFVKRTQSGQPNAAETLRNEARCYSAIFTDDGLAALRDFVPKLYCYSNRENMLVLELVLAAENLLEVQQGGKNCRSDIAVAAGKAIGQYHRNVTELRSRAISRGRPWVLSIDQQKFLPNTTSTHQHLQTFISTTPLLRALQDLQKGWSYESLVHGDLKWENCLLLSDTVEVTLKLIDWETAYVGDLMWDVASMMQSAIMAWVFSIPIENSLPILENAPLPLADVATCTTALWTSYCNERCFNKNTEEKMREKCTRYIGARLVQSAFERSTLGTALDEQMIFGLQVAENLINRPHMGSVFFGTAS